MKKLMSMILCIVTCMTLMSGCGKKTDLSEEVTLKWVINWSEPKDDAKVMEAINEELSKHLPNTKLEIIKATSMESQWGMWMSAGTSYDIASVGYWMDMSGECQDGAFMELTDLIEQYGPNIEAESKEFEMAYASGKMDGKLYAIPNEQPIIHSTPFFGVSPEFWPYFPVDELLAECHANPKTTEKVYQLFEQFFVNLTDAGLIKPGKCSIDVANFFKAVVTRGYDFVVSSKTGAWLCYDAFDENAEIQSFMETDAYRLYIKYAGRWQDMGYISSDYLATGQPSGTNLGSGNTTQNWYKVDEERGVKYQKNENGDILSYQILLDDEDNSFYGMINFGAEKTYNVIPYTSKNPERAIMLLDLLKSPEGEDLLNLIIYGLEGEHYTKEESADGDYVAYGNGYYEQPTSSCAYGVPHWVVSNVFDCYRTPNILDGQKEWALDYIKNLKDDMTNTKYAGFTPNSKEYNQKIADVSSVISEYHTALICGTFGMDGYEAKYDEFMKKMSAVGLEELKEKVQKQADEYLK